MAPDGRRRALQTVSLRASSAVGILDSGRVRDRLSVIRVLEFLVAPLPKVRFDVRELCLRPILGSGVDGGEFFTPTLAVFRFTLFVSGHGGVVLLSSRASTSRRDFASPIFVNRSWGRFKSSDSSSSRRLRCAVSCLASSCSVCFSNCSRFASSRLLYVSMCL
jgi:hypothetical protein